MMYSYNYNENERECLIRLRDNSGATAIITGLIGLVKPNPTVLGLTTLLALVSFGAEVRLKQLGY